MALIKCRNCGHNVSDRAAACPKCGAPVSVQTPRTDAIADVMYREALNSLKQGRYDVARQYIDNRLAAFPSDARFLELKNRLKQAVSAANPQVRNSGADLVSCPHCGKQMSPKALKCPQCGALTPSGERDKERLERERKQKEAQERERERKQKAEREALMYKAAKASLDSKDFGSARNHIDGLLQSDPDNERYKRLNKDYQDAFEQRVKDLRRTMKDCLDSGRLDDAQQDLCQLVAMKADESSYKDLKDRLGAAMEQHNAEVAAAAKKRKVLIGSIAGIVLALVLAAGGYVFYQNGANQREYEAWQQVENTGDMQAIEDYLSNYPDGEHAAQVKVFKASLQAVGEEWAKIEKSDDPKALQDFIAKHPDGPYHDQAVEALDNVMWKKATAAGTSAAYEEYMAQCPQGKHRDEAQQHANQQAEQEQQQAQQQAELKAKQQLTPAESSMVTSRVSSFFSAMANRNGSAMTACVTSPMASFLGKKNASYSDVTAYMNRIHSGDVYGVKVSMGKITVKKTLNAQGDPVYTATFGFDQRLNREDTSLETFAHYNGTATVNAQGKITSLGLNKTTHY